MQSDKAKVAPGSASVRPSRFRSAWYVGAITSAAILLTALALAPDHPSRYLGTAQLRSTGNGTNLPSPAVIQSVLSDRHLFSILQAAQRDLPQALDDHTVTPDQLRYLRAQIRIQTAQVGAASAPAIFIQVASDSAHQSRAVTRETARVLTELLNRASPAPAPDATLSVDRFTLQRARQREQETREALIQALQQQVDSVAGQLKQASPPTAHRQLAAQQPPMPQEPTTYERLTGQLAALQDRRASLLERFTPEHPEVRKLDADMQSLAAKLATVARPQLPSRALSPSDSFPSHPYPADRYHVLAKEQLAELERLHAEHRRTVAVREAAEREAAQSNQATLARSASEPAAARWTLAGTSTVRVDQRGCSKTAAILVAALFSLVGGALAAYLAYRAKPLSFFASAEEVQTVLGLRAVGTLAVQSPIAYPRPAAGLQEPAAGLQDLVRWLTLACEGVAAVAVLMALLMIWGDR